MVRQQVPRVHGDVSLILACSQGEVGRMGIRTVAVDTPSSRGRLSYMRGGKAAAEVSPFNLGHRMNVGVLATNGLD